MNNSKSKLYLHRIEDTILGILKNSPPSIVLKNSRKWENVIFTDRITMKSKNLSEQSIRFDYKHHRTTFMIVVRLLARIYKLLRTNSCITRRELYYEEVQIIQCQKSVDDAIQVICCLIDCPPWDIGVMATSKGLAAGPLLIKSNCSNIIDCSTPGGTLIPFAICSSSVELRSSAKYVLLVEKDATFQRLLNENIFEKMNGVLLITGKGFPDVNTRMLVRKLNHDLKLPVLALVDADPFGIAIMCVYRYGSLSMSRFSEFLATPEIKWLGVHPSDIEIYGLETVPLQQADITKLNSMGKKLVELLLSNKKILKEIQCIFRRGKKAEIEAMCNRGMNYLTEFYIPDKIIRNSFF